MKHLGTVLSGCLNTERVVGEVVVVGSSVSGGKSRELIHSLNLRSSSMSEDTRSTVAGRVVLCSLGVVVLVLSVVITRAIASVGNVKTSTGGTKSSLGLEVLNGDLHVNQVHCVNVRSSDIRASLHPCVDIGAGEVSIIASERKILIRALSSVDQELSVRVRVSTDLFDKSSKFGVRSSSVYGNFRVRLGSEHRVSFKKRVNFGVVENGITSLVVIIFVINFRFEAQVLDELRIPSVNEVGKRAFCDKASKSVVLDHPVEGSDEVIKLLVRVKSESHPGVVHVDVSVRYIFNRVVIVHTLGVEGVVKTLVSILIAG